MKRTLYCALTTVLAVGLVAPAAQATPTAPTTAPAPLGDGATALVEGELVLVTDSRRAPGAGGAPGTGDHGDEVQALLSVDGLLVPLVPEAAEELPSGTRLTVEVAVPTSVVEAVQDGAPVAVEPEVAPGTPDEVVIPPAALDAAEDQAAPAGSQLADATVAAASSGEASTGSAVVAASAPAPVAASGTAAAHDVTVAVVGVGGGAPDSRYSDTEVGRLLSQTNAFWSEMTGGRVTVQRAGAIARYSTARTCAAPYDLWNEAVSRTGFAQGANRHLLLLLPVSSGCSYGLGTVGGGLSTGGLTWVADAHWPTVAHELGHNFSLGHADRLSCTKPAPDALQSSTGAWEDATCTAKPYYDISDVMGYALATQAPGHLSVVGLHRLGLLGAADQVALTASGTRTVELAPLGSGAGLRLATVVDPRSGDTYHLENRQAVGRDVNGWGGSGAHHATSNPRGMVYGLRVLKTGPDRGSVFLDPTPPSCSTECLWDGDNVVKPSTTFTTAGGGVQVRSTQLAGGRVSVAVSVARAGEQHWAGQAPVAPPAAAATAVTVGATTARTTSTTVLPVTVTVPSNASLVPAGTVAVTRGGTALGSATLSRGAASVRLAALPRGRHELQVAFTPAAGSAVAAATTTTTLDVQGAAPRVTASLAQRSVTLAESASLTISVSAPGATPAGTVVVTDGATRVATGTLVRGRATLALPPLPLGPRALVATYSGDAAVAPGASSPAALVVTPLPVSTVTASASKVTTATAPTVTVSTRAAGRAGTGTVALVRSDGQQVATGALVGGRVKVELPLLAAGTHTFAVVHADTPTVTGGRTTATVVVSPARPTVRAGAVTTGAVAGTPVAVTASVTSPAGVATGEVRLVRSGAVLATASLVDGAATLAVPGGLPAGRHSLTLAYAGSSQLTAATTPVSLAVAKAVAKQ